MAEAPTVVIGFSGAATIRHAEDIAARLRQALGSSDHVEIDCSEISEVDITFVQLVMSAHKTAEGAGKTLSLSAPAKGSLLEAVTICGAQNGPRATFWLERRAS